MRRPADFIDARGRHVRVVARRRAYRPAVGRREADAPEVVPPGRAPTGMAFDNGAATATAPPPSRSAATHSAGAGALAPREATGVIAGAGATIARGLRRAYGRAVLNADLPIRRPWRPDFGGLPAARRDVRTN